MECCGTSVFSQAASTRRPSHLRRRTSGRRCIQTRVRSCAAVPAGGARRAAPARPRADGCVPPPRPGRARQRASSPLRDWCRLADRASRVCRHVSQRPLHARLGKALGGASARGVELLRQPAHLTLQVGDRLPQTAFVGVASLEQFPHRRPVQPVRPLPERDPLRSIATPPPQPSHSSRVSIRRRSIRSPQESHVMESATLCGLMLSEVAANRPSGLWTAGPSSRRRS